VNGPVIDMEHLTTRGEEAEKPNLDENPELRV
jgi:hypothetical protein